MAAVSADGSKVWVLILRTSQVPLSQPESVKDSGHYRRLYPPQEQLHHCRLLQRPVLESRLSGAQLENRKLHGRQL
jgi:hypothetical protein